MKDLALTLPGGFQIQPPANSNLPTGSLQTGGAATAVLAIQLLLAAATFLALGYFIYGGYKWMTSAGDPEKKLIARQTLVYAIAGLAIAFSSFTIMNILGAFFGTNFLSF